MSLPPARLTHSRDLTGVASLGLWERDVTAWPTSDTATDAAGSNMQAVQERVFDALTVELSMLEAGEALRLVTAFEEQSFNATLYRLGASLAHAEASQLGAVVRLTPWTPSLDPLPPIGGDLVQRVLAAAPASVTPLPWSLVAGVAGRDSETEGLSLWTRVAERLSHNRLPIAVVVHVERRGPRSRATEVLLDGLDTRARERAARRGRVTAPSEGAVIVGDFALSIGAVGDIQSLRTALKEETGLSIQAGSAGQGAVWGGEIVSLVTARSAARLLPLPVLNPHSTISVARFRPRTTVPAERADPRRAVIVARTATGQDIGFEPLTVNRHLLVVGETGTGKSVTTMSILTQLWNNFGVPWLVIDPLKTEYARIRVVASPDAAGPAVPVRHLRLGQMPLNPLMVPQGAEPLAFASAMAQAFSSTSALGEAFPLGDHIARTAFNELYARQANGTRRETGPRGPTFADLEAALMAASYSEGLSGETANNVRTSLLGRLRAITSGAAGDVFAGGPGAGIDWEELSRFPTVITFPPGLGQQEKSVIYALLVAAHWSWRLAHPTNNRHLIVLEEVHQVYGRTNPVAAAVLDSLLSTMRATGQGYLAVTQSPHQLEDQTQRAFQNVVAHRTRHHSGLEMFEALGPARTDLLDLIDGEVIALLSDPVGVRGHVTNRSGDATRHSPMTQMDSYRADEFIASGPIVRGWCAACPAPCRGRSWLGYAATAAQAADRALAGGADTKSTARAAVDVVNRAVTDRSGGPVSNPAGLYCASARGVTVALGVRGAADATTRAACSEVRASIPAGPRT